MFSPFILAVPLSHGNVLTSSDSHLDSFLNYQEGDEVAILGKTSGNKIWLAQVRNLGSFCKDSCVTDPVNIAHVCTSRSRPMNNLVKFQLFCGPRPDPCLFVCFCNSPNNTCLTSDFKTCL